MTDSSSVNGSENDNIDDDTDGGFTSHGLGYKSIAFVGKSTSTLVSLVFFSVLAYKRDAFMIAFFIGSIWNALLGKTLKILLNQDRPQELAHADDVKLKPSDKGMPSSHAMSLGFISTFTALSLPQTALPLAFFVMSSLYYRVQVKLHTKEQILVGIVVGSTNGYLWNSLTTGEFSLLPTVNIMDLVSQFILNGSVDGILPVRYLAIPAFVGIMVVGSFERRVGRLLTMMKEKKID